MKKVIIVAVVGIVAIAAAAISIPNCSKKPALTQKLSVKWPYAQWAYAKAYTYNFHRMRHLPDFRIYSDKHGWAKRIHQAKILSNVEARAAIKRVNYGKGEIIVSKCPFPRHAIVYFNTKGKPVASVNVCFSCGDVLVWPQYKLTKKEKHTIHTERSTDVKNDKRWRRYARVFPEWKTLFFKKLGLPDYHN